jgi:hypothetical protein
MSMYDTYVLRVQIAAALPREPEGETLAALAGRLRVQNSVNDYQMPVELARKIVKELERDGHAVKVGRSSPARWAFTWGGRPALPPGFLYTARHGQGLAVDTPCWSTRGHRVQLYLEGVVLLGGGAAFSLAPSDQAAAELAASARRAGLDAQWKAKEIYGAGQRAGTVGAPIAGAAKLAKWISENGG